MKTIILSLLLSFSCFVGASLQKSTSLQENDSNIPVMKFSDLNTENMPPVEALVGVVPDKENKDIERGKEIQLAHGGKRCNRRDDCVSRPPIIVPVPQPVYQFSYVCRSGPFYCYVSFPSVVGSNCGCRDFLGYLWFTGTITPN